MLPLCPFPLILIGPLQDIKKLTKQLARCYAGNRRQDHPVQVRYFFLCMTAMERVVCPDTHERFDP